MNVSNKELNLQKIKLLDGFWKMRNQLLCDVIIPYQWDTLNNRTEGVPLSHAVENFRIAAKELEGEPEGTIFQDSDVAKWIEAASYSLMFQSNEKLENIIDELVRLIKKSQHANGYVNTFFTAKGIDLRWSDLEMGHELYCAGHLIEASVAYYQATGKHTFMDVMMLYANLIVEEFGPEEGKLHAYDGHPEIELALYRLSDATNNQRYKDLADYFMNIRGSLDHDLDKTTAIEEMNPRLNNYEADYFLSHTPIREMTEVTGHAVRAMYLYAGMADQYRRTKEPSLWKALTSLWDSLEHKRIYITGGIGSQSHGERFTVDYDLPPNRGYNETCASIGLVFWAWRMSLLDLDSRYADMIEKEIFNGALSGISLDGKAYFYVNPLEINPKVAAFRQDMNHVLSHRAGWFDCACCPTNIARLIGSIGKYVYSSSDSGVCVHQYISSEVEMPIQGESVVLRMTTEYPWNEDVQISLHLKDDARFILSLRKPGWCDTYSLHINGSVNDSYSLEKGYILIDRIWTDADVVLLKLEMRGRFIQSDSRVQDYCGKVALMRGPLVYCLEEIDNGQHLQELVVDSKSDFMLDETMMQSMKSVHMLFDGYRETIRTSRLYEPFKEQEKEKIQLRAIPYFQWGNRAKDQEMRVWVRII